MFPSGVRSRLVAGEPLLGVFAPVGTDGETPGVLMWSAEGGAVIELLDARRTAAWPEGVGGPPFVVHGVLRDGGQLTLLHAWVKRTSMAREPTRVHSSSLALGAWLTGEERWPRARLSTAGLDDWRDDGAFAATPVEDQPDRRRIDVLRPSEDAVVTPDATLVFGGDVDVTVDLESGLSARPRQRVVVRPAEALTIDELRRRHAAPLVALTCLALDRPDDFTEEILFDPSSETRIEMLHSGRIVPRAPRSKRVLLDAAELSDFGGAIAGWWRLHDAVFPALDLFAEAIRDGPIYSRSRFLAVWTALEAYCRERHGRFSPQELVDFSGVPAAATGVGGDSVSLLGVTRKYLGHLSLTGPFTRAEIEQEMLPSIRRLNSLMQAMLLGELGIEPARRAELLEAHHETWPLPSFQRADEP